MYNFATSTCTTSGSTQVCVYAASTSTPLYVQDGGDVQFMLAWLIFFAAIMFVAMLWNTFLGKRVI